MTGQRRSASKAARIPVRTVPITRHTVKSIAAFANLDEAACVELAARMLGREHAKGDIIIAQGASDRNVHFIVSGAVHVTFYSKTGREVGFRDLGAGEMFGELAAIDGLPRSTQVMALRSTFIAVLPPQAFIGLLERQPAVALYVMRRLARLVRLLSDRVVEFSTLGVRNRIHAELLRLARAAAVTGNQARIDAPPTHADLANLISTHREAVTRELRDLTKAGLVRRVKGALLVLDLERLAVMVQDVADAMPTS